MTALEPRIVNFADVPLDGGGTAAAATHQDVDDLVSAAASAHGYTADPVSYTHLTLPTNREV